MGRKILIILLVYGFYLNLKNKKKIHLKLGKWRRRVEVHREQESPNRGIFGHFNWPIGHWGEWGEREWHRRIPVNVELK